jgi:preprotein translocase subunit SecA
MAGRGTDIKLTAETKKAGGLFIIGTERHESRRIDNQLRGRSGRQGDPGKSKFFLSLEDDLMRIFGSDKIKGIMVKLGMKEDEPIEHSMISNAIAKAQKKVETHNFDIRKHLLDFDNVMNEQRKVIYKIRRDILNDEGNHELVNDFIEEVSYNLAEQFKPERKSSLREYPWGEINQTIQNLFGTEETLTPENCDTKANGDLAEYIKQIGVAAIENRFKGFDPEQVKYTFREVLLATFDQFWKDHLLSMDQLKEGINLRSYGQKDPLVEYKREAFNIYENMKFAIKRAVVERIAHIKLMTPEEIEAIHRQQQEMLEAQLRAHQEAEQAKTMAEEKKIIRASVKVGRNDPCPCGSGKKFKACHGA